MSAAAIEPSRCASWPESTAAIRRRRPTQRSVVWDIVGPEVERVGVVANLIRLRERALLAGIPVFYSPHEYSEEFDTWQRHSPLSELIFSRRMFDRDAPGSDFHPDLAPTDGVTVVSPHRGLSGFWSSDLAIQLRQRGVQTLMMAGMAANLCLESHVRDAVEHGFEVYVVADAMAGPGRPATDAAITSLGLIAGSLVDTAEAVALLGAAHIED